MALDLDKISPDRRQQYIRVGAQYSSHDTLAQADQTLNALSTYGAKLEPFGFIAEDTQRLTDARDLLAQAVVGREGARSTKRVSNADYVAALTASRLARQRGRAVLSGVKETLLNNDRKTAAAKVDAVLRQTGRANSSALVMTTQLDLLAKVLSDAEVAPAAKKRSGPQTVQALLAAATALREADRATASRPGTQAETQLMDLLDGIIIELVRRAKEAAVAAAHEHGDAAMASAFKLDKLYRSRHGGSVVVGEDEEEDDDIEIEPTAG